MRPRRYWPAVLILIAALYAGFGIYAPSLNGPFVFDDFGLPYANPEYHGQPLRSWLSGVRPVLMLSYWINQKLAGTSTDWYHIINVLIHVANTFIVFFVLRRLIGRNTPDLARRDLWAGFAAALFLLHPLQSESVAYVAGRSESLSALFILAAVLVFIHLPPGMISWRATVGIAALYIAAVGTKEHAAVLPALLLTTDVYLYGGSITDAIRRRSRLYIALAGVALAGAVIVWRVLSASISAGFQLKDFTWYEYFFTQCRVWYLYLRLFLFPAWQNADYDLRISRTLFEPGVLAGLAVTVIAAALAWRLRKRYPLAVYGFAVWVLLLAPTSSFVPIKDVAAERRVYLPILGLMLIAIEFLARVKIRPAVACALSFILLVAGILSYRRNHVWSSAIAFWSDTVQKSSQKKRGYTHLVYGYLREGRCAEALDRLSTLPATVTPDSEILISWAYTYDCLKRKEDAVQKFEQAASLAPSPGTYFLVGRAYEQLGRYDKSDQAFDEASRLEPTTQFDRMALQVLRNNHEGRSRSRTSETPEPYEDR